MRAIRITRANWLNDAIGGDQNAIRVVEDDMAYEAVEVHGVAVYAPEHDPASAIPIQHVTPELSIEFPDEPKVIDFPGSAEDPDPPHASWEDAAEPGDIDQAPLEQPWTNASKAAWIEWAVNGDHGQPPITGEQAAALNKIELQHRYGGRL